jgi:hypothetical protein
LLKAKEPVSAELEFAWLALTLCSWCSSLSFHIGLENMKCAKSRPTGGRKEGMEGGRKGRRERREERGKEKGRDGGKASL